MMPERDPILKYEDEQRIRALLAAEARADGLRTPESVERVLLGELRRRNRMAAIRRLAGAGAIAATTLFGLFWMRPDSSPVAPKTTPAPVAAVAPPAPVEVAIARPAPPPVRRPAVGQARPRRVVEPTPQLPAEFIPVGAWQALEPMERGAIVRVRMPKSSLPAMGIPVSGDRWNEFIPADIVLGEDGTMRAVRIVNTFQ